MTKYKLDPEEQEIFDAFESGKLVRSPDFIEQKKMAKIAAANYFKKSERINIRLTAHDLARLKSVAAQEGIPYQTLISSVLHKYAVGYLKLGKKSS